MHTDVGLGHRSGLDCSHGGHHGGLVGAFPLAGFHPADVVDH